MLDAAHQTPSKFDEISSWCSLPPKLIGENVFLTAFDPDFSDDVLRFMTDESVAMGIGEPLFSALTREEEKERLSRWKCNFEDGYSFFVWNIEDKKLIGTCCLFDLHPINRTSSLGILIGERDYRRRGLATETIQLVLSYVFETLNLHSVQLEVFEYNEEALECYRKLGFTETGRRREARWTQGRFWDVVFLDILESEWETSCDGTD